MFDVITIGDATFDTFFIIDNDSPQCHLNKDKTQLCLNYADKISLTSIGQSAGGNAANVAVGVKKLGLKTAIVTELGDDMNGLAIEKQLEHAGVDTGLIHTRKNHQTRFSIVLNYRGERTILSYHADRTYVLPKLPQTQWIYYTSLGKTFQLIQEKLIALKKQRPFINIAVNPGSYQLRYGLSNFKKILPHADVLFLNKEEAAKIIGRRQSLKTSIRSLHRLGSKLVVMTDGTHGSYASDGKQSYAMPIFPITPTGKTGAGDAYASGFLAAHISGKSVEEAMLWGTANSTGVIQKIGAQRGLQTKTGIENFIKKFKKIKPVVI